MPHFTMHIICISFPGMKPDPFVYLFPALEGTDVTTRKFKFAVVGLTFVVYALILLAVYLASLLSVNFKSLSDVEKFTWCARLMKVFFFPFPILTGFWYLAVDGTLRNDVVNGTSKTSFIALYMWFGFYILDGSLAALAKLLFGRSYSTALFVHHVGVLITYGGAIFYNGKAHYFVMLGFLFEMAGPLEIDDNAFKRPRKSVLKSPATPTTVYTSSSPPLSPTSNDSSRSAQRKNSMNCCLIM